MLDEIIQFAQESSHPIHNENEDDDNYMNYAAIPIFTQFNSFVIRKNIVSPDILLRSLYY